MKTIHLSIDAELLARVDKAVDELGANRSAFIRRALQLALRRHPLSKLEEQHAAGYTRFPVGPGEFDGWEDEQPQGGA